MISLAPYAPWRARLPLLVLLAGCGGDSTGPDGRGEPGISIVAGANVTDTVDAVLPLALRIVVRDANGSVMPGAVVRFSSVTIQHPVVGPAPSVFVGGLSDLGMSTFLVETTSALGEVLVRIRLAPGAGPGALAIEVPQAGLTDTARFTILPGAATKVVMPVADTTIRVGRPMALNGRVEDRRGNARTEVVTYEVATTGLTITGGQLSASAPARAAIVGRHGSLSPDTTWVSVVPSATIAAYRGTKLVIGSLDGTGLVEIPHTLEVQGDDGPDWHPNGQSLLALLGGFSGPRVLYRVEPSGAMHRAIDPGAPSTGYLHSSTYSPDAQWVYLSGGNCNFNAILYRVPISNPQTVERLSPTGMDECFELVNHWPSLSPDGARLAYENQTGNNRGHSVQVMEIATKAITQIVMGGQRPRWAPAGDLIAFWANQQIWVVRPDGTESRAISPPGRAYLPGARWSPDGQWILARFSPSPSWAGTTAALIHVSTGVEIPLTWTTGYAGISLPAWKPVP